jgi:hypothetical protein
LYTSQGVKNALILNHALNSNETQIVFVAFLVRIVPSFLIVSQIIITSDLE